MRSSIASVTEGLNKARPASPTADSPYEDFKKIDNFAVDGLAGTANSLAYKIAELENYFLSAQQIYGLTSNTMARKAVTPIVVTGGNDAWGTELELHDGTVIESGSSTKMFDINHIFITAVGTANRVTMLEFYKNALATALTAVAIDIDGGTAACTLFTKNDHGYSDGDKIMLSSIDTTTGINVYTVYYVVNKTDNTFELSLTLAGTGITAATNDGTCSTQKITATLIAEAVTSQASTESDTHETTIQMERQLCNSRISCRGWAAGGTNAISFFLGVHTYSA